MGQKKKSLNDEELRNKMIDYYHYYDEIKDQVIMGNRYELPMKDWYKEPETDTSIERYFKDYDADTIERAKEIERKDRKKIFNEMNGSRKYYLAKLDQLVRFGYCRDDGFFEYFVDELRNLREEYKYNRTHKDHHCICSTYIVNGDVVDWDDPSSPDSGYDED